MTHESFRTLHARIEGDPVFQNNSHNPQAPSEYQLLLTLRRLGMGGNGVSVGQMAQVFSVSGKYRVRISLAHHLVTHHPFVVLFAD